MVGQNNFTAKIEGWKAKTPKIIDLVVKQSAQDISNAMSKSVAEGGRMRVDTGFLRGSLVGSTEKMPSINPDAKPQEGKKYPPPDVSMVILGAKPGATIYLGYTAAYALYREYGTGGSPPDGFVRMNAAKWPEIVEANAKAFGLK